jgi:hypothetical protein
MRLLGGQTRRLHQALQQRQDHGAGRVLGLLEGLPLAPERPMRLAQLLFLPLEGAVGAAHGLPSFPRAAIPATTALIARQLPALAAEVEAAAPWHGLADHAVVAGLGGRLWPAAGQALRDGPPDGWIAPGLTPETVLPALELASALWRRAVPLWQASLAVDPPAAVLRTTLAALAAEGPAPLAAGMAFLLRNAARPGLVASLATRLAPELAIAAEAALAARLAAEVASLAECDHAAAMAASAARLAVLLAEPEADAPAPRRALVTRLRREAAQACHGHYAAALAARLLAPATRAAAAPPADDATVVMLEATARDLRGLEAAGRELGQQAEFDRRQEEALRRLARLAEHPAGLSRIELARLAEILAGPEAALALLG